MFGDKFLVGQHDISVDKKNRVFLPADTGRENGDEIFFIYDEDIKKYTLYSKKAFEDKVNKLEELMINAISEEKRLQYKLLLYSFFESVLRKCLVDKQGRVTLNDAFEAGEVITSIGAKDHLILVKKNENKQKK